MIRFSTGTFYHQDEWEALQVTQHSDRLLRVEEEVISDPYLTTIPFTDPSSKKLV